MKRFSAFTLILFFILSCDQGPYKRAMDYNKLGTEHFLTNRDSALYYFEKAIQSDSTFQPAIQNKINVLIEKKKYDEAIKNIDKLIALKPYAEAWQMKGMLLDKIGTPNEAMQAYEKSLSLQKSTLNNQKTEQQKSMENYAIGLTYILMNDTDNGKRIMTNNLEESKNIKSLHDSIMKYAHDKTKLIDLLID